jgi:Uma2 family endonuclease
MLPAEQAEPSLDAERRFLIENVSWHAYVALRDALEDRGPSMTYLEGRLELMSPSERHEEESVVFRRLLDAWTDETQVDLRGFGRTTYRSEGARCGLEPDQCYALGPKSRDAVPQIAVEVIVSNPLLDKLDVYAGLGVQEVWAWLSEARRLHVHRLSGGRYTQHDRSAVLPALDLALLASFVRPGESQMALVREYRAALGASRS